MRRIITVLIISIFFVSCGSKKKVIEEKKKQEEIAVKQPKKVIPHYTTDEYIKLYSKIAQDEMSLYNIPASITLAQGILESGSGNGRLSVKANNHFGIKCHDWTGKRIYHDDDKKGECFRKYKAARSSFRDHSLFLTQRKRYSGLFNLEPGNYKGWAKGLKSAGYATDGKYPQKLISLIERYELYKYDDEILNNKRLVSVKVLPKEKIHMVVKGDTLYYISNMHNISVEDLKRINKLEDNTITVGQKLKVNLD